jgi:hypothetical protein
VLGGGAVGVEMAQAFNRLGCWEVVVLEGADRLLAREEPFAGEELRAVFEAEGIAVVTGARMTAARRLGRDGRLWPAWPTGGSSPAMRSWSRSGAGPPRPTLAWSTSGWSLGARSAWTRRRGRSAFPARGCTRSGPAGLGECDRGGGLQVGGTDPHCFWR